MEAGRPRPPPRRGHRAGPPRRRPSELAQLGITPGSGLTCSLFLSNEPRPLGWCRLICLLFQIVLLEIVSGSSSLTECMWLLLLF